MKEETLLIKIKNLDFSYTSDPFIKNLNLYISSGEFIFLLGKNGSGKSTLIKLLFGIEQFTKGKILVEDMDISEELFKARKIMGLVFQNPDDQIVSDIVETDLAFAMENYGYSKEQMHKTIEEVLTLVNLVNKRKEKVASLSGGEKQRLCIASAMVLNPKILILDEATSMLDTKNREHIMAILKQINKSGTTILIVTHHLNEIEYGQRIILMDKGNISYDGKTISFIENIIKNKDQYNLSLPTSFKIACEFYKKKNLNLSKSIFNAKEMCEIICKSL